MLSQALCQLLQIWVTALGSWIFGSQLIQPDFQLMTLRYFSSRPLFEPVAYSFHLKVLNFDLKIIGKSVESTLNSSSVKCM